MRPRGELNEARFDHDSEVLIGPSSRPFEVGALSQSPFFLQPPTKPCFSRPLSPSSLTELQKRCSVVSVQKKVKDKFNDEEVVVSLRKRMLAWMEAGNPDEQPSRTEKKRKKKEPFEQARSADNILKDIDDSIPDSLKFLAHPHLSSAYSQRESRLDKSCIKPPVCSRLLKASVNPNPMRAEEEQISESGKIRPPTLPLILSISIYARPVRRLWAKEKVEQMMKSSGGDDDDEQNSVSSMDLNRESGPEKERKGQRGMYGPLQLVQKVDILGSNTLQDLREAILCRMDDLPESSPIEEKGKRLPHYTGRKRRTDSCFLIEDILYSEWEDDEENQSHASLLENHIPAKASPLSMQQTNLGSLSLCTGKLYWFLHQGSCEHLWSITSIHAPAVSLPGIAIAAYPLTTFLAYSATLRLIVKWARPTANFDSYSLGKCTLCKAGHANMIIVGGSQFRSEGRKINDTLHANIAGLQEQIEMVCEICFCALEGTKPPSIRDLIERTGMPLAFNLPVKGNPLNSHWTITPCLD